MTRNYSTTLAAYLPERIRESRHRYHQRLKRCQKKFSVAAVHDLRVETRRILALLHLLEALGSIEPPKKLIKRFKKRLDIFDDLRDTQVQLRLLKPLWTTFPEAEPFRKFLSRREEKLISRLARKINLIKYARLNRQLKSIEKALRNGTKPAATGLSSARAVFQESFHRVAVLRRGVRIHEPATIHRLRVGFKRFRYTAELLQPLIPEITKQQLAQMKEYQAAAGDIQDLEVLLRCMGQVVKGRKLNPNALRNLRSELLRQKQDATDFFVDRMDDLFKFQPGPGTPARTQRRRHK